MTKTIVNIVKGSIIGIANIIPGVSGGTMAVSLGIYDTLINAVGNFFKSIKKNLLILLPILIGALLGILLGSKTITYMLENYHTQTIILFIGLIIGGLNLITVKIKKEKSIENILLFILIFFIVLMFNLLNFHSLDIITNNINLLNFVLFILIGFLAGGGMIIPGISGSFILVLVGFYEKIMNIISNITNINLLPANLFVLIPFLIGIIIGIIMIAKIINYLLKKHEVKTYFSILAFVCASIIILFFQIVEINTNLLSISSYIISLVIGIAISKLLEKI